MTGISSVNHRQVTGQFYNRMQSRPAPKSPLTDQLLSVEMGIDPNLTVPITDSVCDDSVRYRINNKVLFALFMLQLTTAAGAALPSKISGESNNNFNRTNNISMQRRAMAPQTQKILADLTHSYQPAPPSQLTSLTSQQPKKMPHKAEEISIEPTHSHQIKHQHRHKRRHLTTLTPQHDLPHTSQQQDLTTMLERLYPQKVNKPPPHIVWRVDNRSPEAIFREGFRAVGTNTDLLSHATGSGMCLRSSQGTFAQNVNGSSFISTTSRESVAINMAQARVQPRANQEERQYVWVYKIQTSSQFFSVTNSLQTTSNRIEDCDSVSLAVRLRLNRLEQLINVARNEHEWAALNHIPPEQIVGASLYYGNSAGELILVPESEVSNVNFVENRTESANPAPWPHVGITTSPELAQTEPIDEIQVVVRPHSPEEQRRSFFSASFCGCCFPSRSARSAEDDHAKFNLRVNGVRVQVPASPAGSVLTNAKKCEIPPRFEIRPQPRQGPLLLNLAAGTCESPAMVHIDALWKGHGYAWKNEQLVETIDNGIFWDKVIKTNRRIIWPEQCSIRFEDDVVVTLCQKNPLFDKYRVVFMVWEGNHHFTHVASAEVDKIHKVFMAHFLPFDPDLPRPQDSTTHIFTGRTERTVILIAPEPKGNFLSREPAHGGQARV